MGTPYPDVIGHVARADQIFGFESILVDKTGVGNVIVDEMEEIGLGNVRRAGSHGSLEGRSVHVPKAVDGAEEAWNIAGRR